MPTKSRRKSQPKPYHHGDLPKALLRAAAQLVTEVGPANLSLREVARRADVSHGAPAHHFRDKAGLLTALATEGFQRFGDALMAARDRAGRKPLARFGATGLAYVLFARDHRAHFEVMWRPELYDCEDAALLGAKAASYSVLAGVVAEAQAAGFAATIPLDVVATRSWALAHGLATLWLHGNLPGVSSAKEIERLARAVMESYLASS